MDSFLLQEMPQQPGFTGKEAGKGVRMNADIVVQLGD